MCVLHETIRTYYTIELTLWWDRGDLFFELIRSIWFRSFAVDADNNNNNNKITHHQPIFIFLSCYFSPSRMYTHHILDVSGFSAWTKENQSQKDRSQLGCVRAIIVDTNNEHESASNDLFIVFSHSRRCSLRAISVVSNWERAILYRFIATLLTNIFVNLSHTIQVRMVG